MDGLMSWKMSPPIMVVRTDTRGPTYFACTNSSPVQPTIRSFISEYRNVHAFAAGLVAGLVLARIARRHHGVPFDWPRAGLLGFGVTDGGSAEISDALW